MKLSKFPTKIENNGYPMPTAIAPIVPKII